ncbi:Transferase [Sesbania bispinosa]|nr:Transferase [Sesbania bispinosa]
MASSPKSSIKIHEQCLVAPPSATQLSLPLTFFDLFWLKFHPVERIFYYTLPLPLSNPSFFFDKVVPKLKASLSQTLQHFLPLAGNIVWPSDSNIPFIQFNPGDGVSLVLAQCDDENANFNQILEHNSPREAIESRGLVPHLESSDSFAAVASLQITLFPNSGFSIGISTHHAALDGKSSTMFIKVWAFICKSDENEKFPSLEPFLDREVIKDRNGLEIFLINTWAELSGNSNKRSLEIMPDLSEPMLENSVRATFELTRGDLEKIKKRVLSQPIDSSSKPTTLSTFVLTCAYVSVCIAKAIEEAEGEKQKFAFAFSMDCRARLELEPPVPENYFGNCVCSNIVDTESEDFTKEDGVVLVAKKIYSEIKMLNNEEKRAIDGIETTMSRYVSLLSEGVKAMGVAGSTRFGVYGIDFGWGRPSKVEIVSVDRGLTIGIAESKDGKGGVEVGLVLNKHVMDLFSTFFHAGLCFD